MQHTVANWDCLEFRGKTAGPARLLQAPDDQFDWEAIEADTKTTYLLNLVAPQRFYDSAPLHWERPRALSPLDGIPQNVWLGMDFGPSFTDLLALWSTKRFLLLRDHEDFELLEHALDFVRCSNCGTRYNVPTKLCRHLKVCGDARLLPQIEIFTGQAEWAKETIEERGARWLPWPC